MKTNLVEIQVPNKRIIVRYNGKPCVVSNRHPTVAIIVQFDPISGMVEVIETREWRFERFLDVVEEIAQLAYTYSVHLILCDRSHIGNNQELIAKGLPVIEVAFTNEKAIMRSNLRALIEQHKIKIWVGFEKLIEQLRIYTRDTKRNDDYVDALMLACRDIGRRVQEISNPKLYISF